MSARRDHSLVRVDLHCHSEASNHAGEALLNAIGCPESYSRPIDIHRQARARGMRFVALTDHDTIDGALRLADGRDDVIVGEELTCFFPSDGCKIHLLVYGMTPAHHDALQRLAPDIHDVAEYIERERLAHAVAHPLYRQNDRLEHWHLERLILLFKGFEVLNGAHSALHRSSFEGMLNQSTRQTLQALADRHRLVPRWHEPWYKARIGGSDDHGLLNVGRTWTEFPADTHSVADVLQCLRDGACQPGGEAGSSLKLAHNFYSVAVRFHSRRMSRGDGDAPMVARILAGEQPPPSRRGLAARMLRQKLGHAASKLKRPFARRRRPPVEGAAMIARMFVESIRSRLGEHPGLTAALHAGRPPLAEHDDLFALFTQIDRDLSNGIAAHAGRSLDNASILGIFDALGAAAAQQFMLLPYYFALFHQNRERAILSRLTRSPRTLDASTLRVGLFTDTFDDINGVGRFIRDMGEQAHRAGRRFIVHTCVETPRFENPCRRNFRPVFTRAMPYYPDLNFALPPVLEILSWADRQQFDAIHVSTPGPMGLCGWLAGKMLRVPVLATYHTDFPAYVEHLTGDYRITALTTAFMKWFYRQTATVFSRSDDYRAALRGLGVADGAMRNILPGINTDKFSPVHRDADVWQRLGVKEPRRVLYCGRVSVEKNLPMLVDAFRRLCDMRRDTALVIAGDGPFGQRMREALKGLPAYFLGYQNDQQLGPLYASADLFAFPSTTDTLGQVVMEAQASGLPVFVTDIGGPREIMDDGVTGRVLPADDPQAWADAIADLLDDESTRQRMSRTAPGRINRFSLTRTFEAFWDEHLAAASRRDDESVEPAPIGEPVVHPQPTAV